MTTPVIAGIRASADDLIVVGLELREIGTRTCQLSDSCYWCRIAVGPPKALRAKVRQV